MDLRPGIKVDQTFLVALAQNHAFPFGKVDVLTVQCDQFPNTHP